MFQVDTSCNLALSETPFSNPGIFFIYIFKFLYKSVFLNILSFCKLHHHFSQHCYSYGLHENACIMFLNSLLPFFRRIHSSSVLLKLSCMLESPGKLLKIQLSGPHPRPINQNLRVCSPSGGILKLPGSSSVPSRLRPAALVNGNLQREL